MTQPRFEPQGKEVKQPNLRSAIGNRILSTSVSLLLLAGIVSQPLVAGIFTVTNTGDSGPGSLRDALGQAASGDTVIFNVTGTITLASTINIGTNVTINGPGPSALAISGNNAVQIFAVLQGTNVSISGVKIENANSAGAYYGGAVVNFGTLALNNIVATGNSGSQGAILNVGGTLTLNNSTLSGNSASYYGGGIENSAPGYPSLTVVDSTISGNYASVQGGGIANNTGRLTLINSTIVNNTTGYLGGGIYNNDTMTAVFTTIAGNSGPNGAGMYAPGASSTLKNVLMANGTTGGNCVGSVISLGHNLSDDLSCGLNGSGDLSNVPAGLDPAGLANNGGTTQTVALLSTSPALDAVPLSYCTDANGAAVTTDQRNVSRPQGPACDIGSFERVEAVYHICLLYDSTKAVPSGATDPIKLQLCDASGNDQSSSALIVHATNITQTSSTISGEVEYPGNANPDDNFRFDATLGPTGGYIFNLKTSGLATGTYSLAFTVTGDSFTYSVPFQVK